MKKTIPFLIAPILFITGCTNSGEKYFTGTIEYSYAYTSDSLNADSLAATRPGKSDFRYDLSDYQSRFVGKDTETYYYSGDLNKSIGEINDQHNYTCEDYSVVTDSVISWKIYDSDEKVLGQQCRILEMQKGNSWVKYYVSTEMKIAPATYQKHRSYNWDFYGEKASGGLILRSEHRFKKFTMKGEATAVSEEGSDFKALTIDNKKINEICNKQ